MKTVRQRRLTRLRGCQSSLHAHGHKVALTTGTKKRKSEPQSRKKKAAFIWSVDPQIRWHGEERPARSIHA